MDKTEFNERTRSALMKVAYLASLELRVESLGLNLGPTLRGLPGPFSPGPQS